MIFRSLKRGSSSQNKRVGRSAQRLQMRHVGADERVYAACIAERIHLRLQKLDLAGLVTFDGDT